jgi:hypothetical protein
MIIGEKLVDLGLFTKIDFMGKASDFLRNVDYLEMKN